jgi:hypothetical protein
MMAKTTPTNFDPAEEPKVTPATKAATPQVSAPEKEAPTPVQGTYPGQTLGIVALTLSFFFQIPALAMGIVAWVWSHKAGKNNLPAKISVFVSGALIVLGTFLFGLWIALVGSLVGGFDGGFDRDHDGPKSGGGTVHVMPGDGGMMFEGDMDEMMEELERQMGDHGRMMPSPSDLPLDAPLSN